MKKRYAIIIIFCALAALILLLTSKNKVQPKPVPGIASALMADTTHYYPLHISKELRTALLKITDTDNFEEITSEFFSADTLCRLNIADYLVNVRYTYGCSSPGYCNMIFCVSDSVAKRVNDIKGYIDSTDCAKPGPFIYITLSDGSYMKRYRLVYTGGGFRFKNFISADSVFNGNSKRMDPSKTDLDAKVINSEIQ